MRTWGTSLAAAVLTLGLLACSESSKDEREVAGSAGTAPGTPSPHADLACSDCHSQNFARNVVGHASGSTCTTCHAPKDLSPEVTWGGVRFAHLTHPGSDGQEYLDCSACHTHESGDSDLSLSTNSCVLCHGETYFAKGSARNATAPPRSTGSGSTARLAVLPESDCATCHGVALHQASAGIGRPPIDHATVTARGLSCLQCHFDVVKGTGAVDDATCAECHLSAGTNAPLDRAQLRYDSSADAGAEIHRAHYAGGEGPSCLRCHTEVAHEVGNLLDAVSLECNSCHSADEWEDAEVDSAYHEPQQLLFAGLLPGDGPAKPAPKFLARLGCGSCHAAEGTDGSVLYATDSCTSCHGQRFDGLSVGWSQGMAQRTAATAKYVRAAVDAIGSGPFTEADAILAGALRNVEWVEQGLGVHNLETSDALLREAMDSVEEAYGIVGVRAPRRPSLGPAIDDNDCMRCHYGVDVDPRIGLPGAASFPHSAHVNGGTDCGECHSSVGLFEDDDKTFDPDHGQTLIGTDDCHRCHHVETLANYKAAEERAPGTDGEFMKTAESRACARCHSGMERLPEKPKVVNVAVRVRNQFGSNRPERDVTWSHENHSSLACEECHTQPLTLAATTEANDCSGCHESHHAEGRNCSSCHTGYNIQAAHSVENPHFACAECHDKQTVSMLHPQPEYCQTCHTGIADHVAERQADPKSCVECHMLTSPAEYRLRILEGS